MKNNNQGFTLVGVMGIGAVLSVVAVVGLQMANHNAKLADNAQTNSDSNRVVASVNQGAEAAIEGSAGLQFEPNTALNIQNQIQLPVIPEEERTRLEGVYTPGTETISGPQTPIEPPTTTTTTTSYSTPVITDSFAEPISETLQPAEIISPITETPPTLNRNLNTLSY